MGLTIGDGQKRRAVEDGCLLRVERERTESTDKGQTGEWFGDVKHNSIRATDNASAAGKISTII